MKILSLNSYFLLPDDFEGNANDAIRELVKYRESKDLTNFKGLSLKEIGIDAHWDNLDDADKWNAFLDVVDRGYKHLGSIKFDEYKDGMWSRIE